MPGPKQKDKRYEALLDQLKSLEAQKMAEMAAVSAAPAPAAHMYAPLVEAIRQKTAPRYAPRSAAEAEEYGRKWNQQHTQEALDDYGYLPEGGQKPAYLEELKRRGAMPGAAVIPAAVPYKLAPEMVIRPSPDMDANLDETKAPPVQYLPTQEYPGRTGVRMDRVTDTVVEPAPKSEAEKAQEIEDELRMQKWKQRLLPEFQTPESRITYKL
jgi:hypothetical protein